MLAITTDTWRHVACLPHCLSREEKIHIKTGLFLALKGSEPKGVQLGLTVNKSSKWQTKTCAIFRKLQFPEIGSCNIYWAQQENFMYTCPSQNLHIQSEQKGWQVRLCYTETFEPVSPVSEFLIFLQAFGQEFHVLKGMRVNCQWE